MSLHHSFDIDLASQYGVEESILIHHFLHWIRFNKASNKNFHEGRTWMYQTLDDIANHFPYWSKDNVRDLIERLCNGKNRKSKKEDQEFEPVLIKGNFNKIPFDRTVWYAFKDENKFMIKTQKSNNYYERGNPQIGNGDLPKSSVGEIPTPIPDTKTNKSINNIQTNNRSADPQLSNCQAPPVGVANCQTVKINLKKEAVEFKEKELFEEISNRNQDNWSDSEIHRAIAVIKTYDGKINNLIEFVRGTIKNFRDKDLTGIARKTADYVVKNEHQMPKSQKYLNYQDNFKWCDSIMMEKRYLQREGKVVMHQNYIEFTQFPEGKVYYSDSGFKEIFNSFMRKIETLEDDVIAGLV